MTEKQKRVEAFEKWWYEEENPPHWDVMTPEERCQEAWHAATLAQQAATPAPDAQADQKRHCGKPMGAVFTGLVHTHTICDTCGYGYQIAPAPAAQSLTGSKIYLIAEIELIRTDPDTVLSSGAKRSLAYIENAILAQQAAAPADAAQADNQEWRELRAALNILVVGKASAETMRELARAVLEDFDKLTAARAQQPAKSAVPAPKSHLGRWSEVIDQFPVSRESGAEQPAESAVPAGERDAFESVFCGLAFTSHTNGEYLNPYVEHMWEGWQRRAAQPRQGAELSIEQREAICEVMALARDEGLPGTAEVLASILRATNDTGASNDSRQAGSNTGDA